MKSESSKDLFAVPREQMLNVLRRYGIKDECILAAMAKVPRHRFIPREQLDLAYDDDPISIGYGQTISQPYMVALMTYHMALTGEEKVLEIGTGSGYQTALLAELSKEVYTIERVEPLLRKAEKCLTELDYTNIHFRTGDGSVGWPEEAPFDAIISTAAAPEIAQPWKEQLADGGRIVVPVGPRFGQTLLVGTKHGETWEEKAVCACVFVPLLGRFGWKEDDFWRG